MEFAGIVKAYLEVGVLGLNAIMLIIMFYENHKRSHAKEDEKDKLLGDNSKSLDDKLNKVLDTIQSQNDYLIKNQEKHFQDIQSHNEEVVRAVVNGVVTHVPSSDENEKLSKINNQIDGTLQAMLLATGASRVSLVQYHNGGKGVNRQSFLKMSMTNEQVQLGIVPFMTEFKDQFRSVLSYFITQLNNNGYCYIEDVEKVKDIDTSIYEFMKSRKIKSKFGYAVRNPEGSVIAFLCIEFVEGASSIVDVDKIDQCFKEYHKIFDTLLNM